jgi:hypothetical protein
MNHYFTYSVLQYKHSLVLGESLNVGILFYFPDENHIEFVSGDGTRAKAIYPDFDNSLFNGYLRTILDRVNKQVDLFNEKPGESEFPAYIHKAILAEDAAGLIFKEPVSVRNVFGDRRKAVDEYAGLLLPGINIIRPSIIKHNENYIIKKFNGYVFGQDKSLEERFKKNESITTKHFKIKFDLSWNKGIYHYIKPVSFDYADELSIQNKAATFFGYLSDLGKSPPKQQSSFDLLIAKPREPEFNKVYENALDFLNSADAPKKIITEDQIEQYSREVLAELNSN